MIEKAFANDGDLGDYTPPVSIAPETTDVIELLVKIADYLIIFVGSAACLALIIAGIMWATAMGDDEKISQAKRLIKWSIIGLIIALSAWGIVSLVIEMFAPDMTNI